MPRATVPPGLPEKRHLRDLGVTGGHRNYLDSDDLLLFARGVGHTLQKLLNSGFRAAYLKKTVTLVTLPSLAWYIQALTIFLHTATTHSKQNVSAQPWE